MNSTREQLLDVAQDLIQRRGLNGMSFQDLSDAVGIRKASVHHHFASKGEMVNALLERYLTGFDRDVEAILNARCLGKTKLKRYCELFLSTLAESRNEKACLCGMLVAEMLSLAEEELGQVRRFFLENAGFIQEIIQMGIEDGSLQVQGSLKATADLVLSTLEGGLFLARCEGGPRRFEEITGRLIALLSADR